MKEKNEEMRKEVKSIHRFFMEDDDYEDLDEYIADELYNAGYRKVIQCKDCVFCEVVYPVKMLGKEAEEVWYCRLLRQCTKPDVFCSFAKMKGGAE